MKITDTLVTAYAADLAFQTAFRAYFGELGCPVTNWEGLFAEMDEAADSPTWTRRDESGRVIAFIQFTMLEMTSWFFTAKYGFIREFWVAPEYRRQGHGGALLRLAEESIAGQGATQAILTTDTAPDFYRKRGYVHNPGFAAKNGDAVFVKVFILISE